MDSSLPTTLDSFLDNRLLIEQPKNGYRAGLDAVLLGCAAAAIARPNICELGSGVGAAILGAIALQDNIIKSATAIEIDSAAFELLNSNIARNKTKALICALNQNGLEASADIDGKFDLVFSNPPFFDDEKSIRGPKQERKAAYIIGAPLEVWIKAMLRLSSAKGRILLVHRAERINDILAALKNRAGDIRIFPIRPNCNAPANRIMVCATKANRAPTQIFSGLDIHPIDSDARFTELAEAVFAGKNLEIWNCLK